MTPSLFRAVRPAAHFYRSSATSSSSRLLSTTARRSLATEAQDTTPSAKAAPTSPATSAFTVEELHDKSAHEILREGGSRKDRSLRHFTVNFGPQHPAAHGVLRLILELNGEEILRTDVSFGPDAQRQSACSSTGRHDALCSSRFAKPTLLTLSNLVCSGHLVFASCSLTSVSCTEVPKS